MRYITLTSPFSNAAATAPSTVGDAIEWEELPSLADSLTERLKVLGTRHRDAVAAAQARALMFERVAHGTAWDATRPADLMPAAPSEPFREPYNGVAVREVTEPDLFRHFFGQAAVR